VSHRTDFGPDVKIFDTSTPLDEINSYLLALSEESEFSERRHAVFFLPGVYGSAEGAHDPATATGIVNAEVGFYTSIHGLGASPADVVINGSLHVEPNQPASGPAESSSLTQFWRSLSNLTINPIQRPVGIDAGREYPEGVADPHTMRWATSQAAPLRRVHIRGDLDLTGRHGAYAFGTCLVNSAVDGRVISGDWTRAKAQAHWFTRDSRIGAWDGTAVNFVFSGVTGAPATDFDPGDKTSIPETAMVREAPFLFLDGDEYAVFVPSVQSNTSGVNWSTEQSAGVVVPIERFFLARPSDSAATMNAELAAGRNLILTPGIYLLDAPLAVHRNDAVVLGLGYASLTPTRGTAALEIGDVDGVVVAGLTVDAGLPASEVLIRIGTPGVRSGSATNPTTFNDVFVRVGGQRPGQATTSVEINSDHVILDHSWLWRADHGAGAGWLDNPADHGLVVNGDDVTALGLFVEHYQKQQVLWNGERGVTMFYQSEMPYDPPSQAEWMNGNDEGYASYVVAPQVREHRATGLGVYTLFLAGFAGGRGPLSGPQIHVLSAIEAPEQPEVHFQSMAAAVINGGGGIRHVFNRSGDSVDASSPGGDSFGMTAISRLRSSRR
jgi:hypothetical protein